MILDNRIHSKQQSALAQLIAMCPILQMTNRTHGENKPLRRIPLHKRIEQNLTRPKRKTLPGKLLRITLETIRHNLPSGIEPERPSRT